MSLPPELEDPIPLSKGDEPPPTIDVMRARRETPGWANVLHFNNAEDEAQRFLEAVEELAT
jgi:hypothetical protein